MDSSEEVTQVVPVQQDALAPHTVSDVLEASTGTLGRILEALAIVFSGDITPVQLVTGHVGLKMVNKAVEDLTKQVRNRIVALVEAEGQDKPDTKGMKELRIGNMMVPITPHKTGLDEKKLEAHLRARELDPSLCMDAKITWTVNDEKVRAAVAAKTITADELAACAVKRTWNLQDPKPVGNGS